MEKSIVTPSCRTAASDAVIKPVSYTHLDVYKRQFGNIIKSSGIGDVIANGLASANMPILLLPFLMAAILKLVLGSGTVAMTTTATICAPILMQIPGANMMYCAYAACIGSQVFSLHNDSFFWVLTLSLIHI